MGEFFLSLNNRLLLLSSQQNLAKVTISLSDTPDLYSVWIDGIYSDQQFTTTNKTITFSVGVGSTLSIQYTPSSGGPVGAEWWTYTITTSKQDIQIKQAWSPISLDIVPLTIGPHQIEYVHYFP